MENYVLKSRTVLTEWRDTVLKIMKIASRIQPFSRIMGSLNLDKVSYVSVKVVNQQDREHSS